MPALSWTSPEQLCHTLQDNVCRRIPFAHIPEANQKAKAIAWDKDRIIPQMEKVA